MVAEERHGPHGQSLLAVDGQGIHFHFGRKNKSAILNGVNIAVKRGAIYSLLGPSGCGKTTLLKCIVGQHKPKAGSLKIFGRSAGSKGFFIPGGGVGYMPQDLALYMDMNTEEILTYFGSLYGMGMKNINERITFLVGLLKLPDKRKQIQHLSGGQQRRVSFAIALIHKAPLVILDEPTVGVDPLLRKGIWDHLVDLARTERVTVIITTHYTEEARSADTVGLMRHGQLLVESNPEDLINQCGVLTLEDVFLKLCPRNHNEHEDLDSNFGNLITGRNLSPKYFGTTEAFPNETETGESSASGMKFVKSSDGSFHQRNEIQENTVALLPLPSIPTEFDKETFSTTNSPTRLFYLTRKNFIRLKRNISLMLFMIGSCPIQVAVFFLTLTSDPFDLQIAIVNEEGGLNKFGETFLLSMSNRTFNKKPFDNFTLAYESLTKGESFAVLRIDPEFSSCLVERVRKGIDASNETILCSTIKLILDMSNQINAATIRRGVLESYQAFTREFFGSLGKQSLLGQVPVHFEEYNHGAKAATLADFLISGVILCIAYITSSALSTMLMLAERKQGLLGRAKVAGATTAEVLLSFFFTQLVILFLQVLGMLLVTFWVFNVPCNGPVFWVTVAVILSGICGISYGFLISAVTDDENASGIIGCGSVLPIVLSSAVLWPIDTMPHYLRYICSCLPLTRIIDATRSIMTRGWNITENHIWDGYLICSSWVAGQLALCIILLKIRK